MNLLGRLPRRPSSDLEAARLAWPPFSQPSRDRRRCRQKCFRVSRLVARWRRISRDRHGHAASRSPEIPASASPATNIISRFGTGSDFRIGDVDVRHRACSACPSRGRLLCSRTSAKTRRRRLEMPPHDYVALIVELGDHWSMALSSTFRAPTRKVLRELAQAGSPERFSRAAGGKLPRVQRALASQDQSRHRRSRTRNDSANSRRRPAPADGFDQYVTRPTRRTVISS